MTTKLPALAIASLRAGRFETPFYEDILYD